MFKEPTKVKLSCILLAFTAVVNKKRLLEIQLDNHKHWNKKTMQLRPLPPIYALATSKRTVEVNTKNLSLSANWFLLRLCPVVPRDIWLPPHIGLFMQAFCEGDEYALLLDTLLNIQYTSNGLELIDTLVWTVCLFGWWNQVNYEHGNPEFIQTMSWHWFVEDYWGWSTFYTIKPKISPCLRESSVTESLRLPTVSNNDVENSTQV